MPNKTLPAEKLVEIIAFDTKLTKHSVRTVLASLNIMARGALLTGASVTIPGLVRLDLKTRPARNGRNPSTGEPLVTPAKRVVAARVMPSLTLPQD